MFYRHIYGIAAVVCARLYIYKCLCVRRNKYDSGIFMSKNSIDIIINANDKSPFLTFIYFLPLNRDKKRFLFRLIFRVLLLYHNPQWTHAHSITKILWTVHNQNRFKFFFCCKNEMPMKCLQWVFMKNQYFSFKFGRLFTWFADLFLVCSFRTSSNLYYKNLSDAFIKSNDCNWNNQFHIWFEIIFA